MSKPIKAGKVVIILAGRYAGKKAIVVKTFDDGNAQRGFGHCLVAGIDQNPRAVTKSMSKKKILKRSRVKPFIKFVNYNHIMPTRYTVNDIDVKSVVNPAIMKKLDTRIEARKAVKTMFEERYINRGKNSSGVQYFFKRLRF
eukprot:CAMPEP_0205818870 /NCGR_PEP_ID=MMETSP0206-20130828/954_1 /ASSEMBLY_ACC=CAM_ASM_000279 /TAXON_ID=36767 /ORGANISM="Euplotes focardii, Strain TN1" /LENGTH=141 /DNA_ID=CAMNT_0053111695 /DNA_START=38 /DNA_END=463 /DNA_ORIENTATION=+